MATKKPKPKKSKRREAREAIDSTRKAFDLLNQIGKRVDVLREHYAGAELALAAGDFAQASNEIAAVTLAASELVRRLSDAQCPHLAAAVRSSKERRR